MKATNERNEKAAKLLNQLVEINNDRIEGYERATSETEDSDLESLFTQMASTSRQLKIELSSQVRNCGAEPTNGTTVSGKFYRAWMDVKAAMTGKDRKAILSSCEYGEDVALKTYEEVMKSEDLPADLRSLITSQHAILQSEHDRVKAMRDSVTA